MAADYVRNRTGEGWRKRPFGRPAGRNCPAKPPAENNCRVKKCRQLFGVDARNLDDFSDRFPLSCAEFIEFGAIAADDFEAEAGRCLAARLPIPAYDYVLKCSHAFNLLDARGVISVTDRTAHIGRVRALARKVAALYLQVVAGEGGGEGGADAPQTAAPDEAAP